MKLANSQQRKNERRKRALARMVHPHDNSWNNDNSAHPYIRTYRAMHDDGERHGPSLLTAGTDVAEVTRDDHAGILVLGTPKAARAGRRQLLLPVGRKTA